ncbi:CoA transferase subunit A [Frigoribacterium sp. CG_9.8]|uniref:CoA transferase subunit A n=1 Tax=Frigoribacterium sp. CG_9.8 TaxID=2787733 RepID=UPI0018CB931D|nr:CoA transferase subunit A [Frigoribacterium sp. CG_9.8]MBG6107823.1 3-oxoacid CoA-transferase subunit A [Frigoribacterium sp. CG_9.8]
MTKQWSSAREAIHDVIHDGSTIAVGGFGLSGNPSDLIEAVRESGARDLTIVSNNMGVDGQGLGILLENHQVTRVLASYVGENKLFAAQFLNGELEVEFVPQGTLAERLRAGGAGIAGFYTKTGVGTPIAEGKELHEFDGELFVLERGIITDLALVRAHRADRAGNLVYHFAARNFNPNVATAGRVTIVEAEEISEGYLDPEVIVTPGIFVQRLVLATTRVKAIEQRTVRPRPTVEV